MGKHCAAAELLLARMDSNPEEFTRGGRWEKLIASYRSYLPMEDRIALEDKLNTLWLEVFHKEVMSELLAEPREDAVVDPGFYQSTIPTPYTATIGASSPTMNLSSQSIKDLAAQLQQYASNAWKK